MTAAAPPRDTPAWHALPVADVERRLGSGARGLASDEAAARLQRVGPNALPRQDGPGDARLMLRQVASPLTLVLLVAGLVTLTLGEHVDAGVIFGVVLVNAIVGFAQERQAARAVAALFDLVAPRAKVVRDGVEVEIDSREVVPGDLVRLESGARVPADIRIVAASVLFVDESALTGESAPVAKSAADLPASAPVAERHGIVHAGTIVTSGRGRGYVVATGRDTELGQIAADVERSTGTVTPLQARLARFARVIGIGVGAAAVGAFALGVATGEPAEEMFVIAVALAVSAIPEGLPIAFTVTLALGVRRMARRQAIVRNLPAVEALGSATVIGSDKTGTLTENRMTVRELWTPQRALSLEEDHASALADAADDAQLRALVIAGVLANEATIVRGADGWEVRGDPIDGASLILAALMGLDVGAEQDACPLLADVPFESERQYSAMVRLVGGERRAVIKGAPERVVAMCAAMRTDAGVAPLDRELALAAAHEMAGRGLRVLALAERSQDEAGGDGDPIGRLDDLVLVGLQGMADPPRAGAREAIAACRDAGIRVLMITGDHAATAEAIARELGIGAGDGVVVTGAELDAMDAGSFAGAVATVDIFARVAPEQKLAIVHALQAQGEVVAVTGDGVNDAPALRAADIGVAMGRRGTDVAREAADIVLADDAFASIAGAVQEGRITFANVRKVTAYLFTTNVAEVAIIIIALALGWNSPLLAVQILWLNLITDSLPALALAAERAEPDAMRRPPRGRAEGILSRQLWERVVVGGVAMTIAALALYRWDLGRTGDVDHARSVTLAALVLFQMAQALAMRAGDAGLLRRPPWGNRALLAAVAGTVAVHAGVVSWGPSRDALGISPLSLETWGVVLLATMAVLAVGEVHRALRASAWRRR